MNFLSKTSWGSAGLILLFVLILAILGNLQYHASEQVSEATARDMEESLQSALFDFRQSLERELSGLCLELQPASSGSRTAVPRELAQRLNQWRQTAQHPALVTDVLLWDGREGDLPMHVFPSGLFKPSPWPANLEGLSAELTALLSEGADNAGPAHSEMHRSRRLFGKSSEFGWMLDQERMALLHPAFSGEPGSEQVAWLVVPLQRELLIQHILPELVKREFGGHSESYKVAVILDGDRRTVLYTSEPDFGAGSAFDARLNLFGPPSLVRGTRVAGMIFPAFAESSSDRPALFIDPIVQSDGTRTLAVLAQHRQGSLEAAVARLRERSLAVSFAVLGVLAITLAMIVVTSQRARRLAQMEMDFVTGVSHELRTPLTAILLAARNLEDGVVGKNGLMRYGAAIKNQAAQLSALVEEILLFSETRSGRHTYKVEAVDVPLAIENTLESLAPLIDSSGATLEEQVDPDLPLAVGDTAAFSQCLQNLITNSLKYGGEQKKTEVRAYAASSEGSREVCVSVRDHGLGIGSGEIKQIFEPFYRSPEVVAAQIHGNGLGLPLTKTMVEAMKGRITVTSDPGKGSTFTIALRQANGAGKTAR